MIPIRDLKKIGILGTGMTAKAVTQKAMDLGLLIVTPEEADIVIASPGIPPKSFPSVTCEIISEIEFAYRYLISEQRPPSIIGITGTNGKSTVTAMIAHILDCPMAGNIGIPLIRYVATPDKTTPRPKQIVVELSSYQLETCNTLRPHVAVVLGLTPDHIDRHPTMESYAAAKQRLIATQTPDDVVIYDATNTWSRHIAEQSHAKKQPLTESATLYHDIITLTQTQTCLGLIGKHNHLNALAAGLVARVYGIPDARILEKLSSYQALPHRIEWVGTLNGCRVFNDSKATNPESTDVALAAFAAPMHVILGGKDKGLDLEEFAGRVAEKAASITVFGEIADRLVAVLRTVKHPLPPLAQTVTLAEALTQSLSFSKPDEVILFSPACSSFDQFQSFEHRGDVFRDMVQERMNDVS